MTPFGPIGSDSSGRLRPVLRADLHVHSRYSGPGHLRGAGARAGIGEPAEIYRAAKRRGMGLVTLTDLDTIEGCLRFLESHPGAGDFVISEEVTTLDPRTGRTFHVLVFGLDEDQHRAIAKARADVRDLGGYLRGEGLPAAVGAGTGDGRAGFLSDADRGTLLQLFDLVEVRSGAHGRRRNDLTGCLAQARRTDRRPAATGGSCAHGEARVGTTWTAARAAGVPEFMAELRHGRTWAGGADGGPWVLGRDLSRSVARGYMERPARLLGLPFDLLRLPIQQGWQQVRAAAHVRRSRRNLDLEDLSEFQRKARTYLLPARAAGGSAEEGS